MAKSLLSIDEGPMSPDLFSDNEQTLDSIPSPLFEDSFNLSDTKNEPELADSSPEWKGMSMDEIHKGLGSFGFQQHPPITPSDSHTVLFRLPLDNLGPPRPYPTHQSDKWDVNYVRMPHSQHSLYPIQNDEKPREFRVRWEVIQEALLQNFVSVAQLETAIFSYNDKYAQRWDFSALHNFFSEVMDEEATEMFFQKLLPKMVQLAMQLPALITGSLPLLRKHKNSSVSLSQLQVASLLANAFFCTFPRRNSTNPQSEYGNYPFINFNRLFSAFKEDKPDRSAAVTEKIKCICHYFRRVTTSAPEGTITIQRSYIPKENCPRWDKMTEQLPPLHVTSKGTIETEGAGLLQVDFANKYVGGGVLHWGCVQEEIRFVICPELMVTMLITEVLDDTEALIVTGAERYSEYEGYRGTFKWTGDFIDETPRDNSGRRRTSIVAIDAMYFSNANEQFKTKNIIRELNKAFVGFSSSEMHHDDLSAIATGNWGCGAFRGNPKLKVLIQLMAAAVAKRPMVYFTFGDCEIRDKIAEMYWHLVDRNVEIGTLFALLRQYEDESTTNHSDFYRFLFNRSKIKPLTKYFDVLKKTNDSSEALKKKSEHSSLSSKAPIVDKPIKEEKEKSSQVLKIENWDEKENEKIRDLLDNCGKNDDVIEGNKQEIKTSPVVKVVEEKKRSLWSIIEEQETFKDKIPDKPQNQRYSSLNLFVKKTPTMSSTSKANDFIDNTKKKSPIKESKKVPNSKTLSSKTNADVQKTGQTKIVDFFSLKNV